MTADVAVQFTTADCALRFAADLATTAGAHDATQILRDGDTWWIAARDVDLPFARAAAHAAEGTTYLRTGDLFTRDAMISDHLASTTDRAVDLDVFEQATILDLIQQAGLQPQTPRPQREAVILLPGSVAPGVIRRAMDLDISVSYRAVSLTPLFNPPHPPPDPNLTIELVLYATQDRPIPSSLLAAIATRPLTLVTRPADTDHRVLLQRGRSASLAEHRLAALAGDDSTWILADAGYGCWRLNSHSPLVSGAELVRLGDDITLENLPSGDDRTRIEPRPVRLVPAPVRRSDVDAVLLNPADLDVLTLLLEDDPLADIAILVPGTSRHLLLAPGGILREIGIGEPLACIGPGLLYVPLGRRMSPRVPLEARQRLYQPDASHAVVVTDHSALRFDLEGRRPAWTLWVGPAPAIDQQLPADTLTVLRGIDADRTPPPAPAARPWPRPRIQPEAPADWRDEALQAESRGDLARAAALHRQHKDPRRAGHLYERAAIDGASPPPSPSRSLWNPFRRRPPAN
ncbi:hypothetical protein [Catellatospora coxensis]|uniref:hypothetical protein n=1 Tax=Catellatospora coxensis TaxID=310354 RepID=UPI00194179B5|nr:hypothetical protein [Catellatospora coxensis]